MYRALQKLENGEFTTLVYYIMGKPGAGKTWFATEFAHRLIKTVKEKSGENWSLGKTASTNPVDDYRGEEVLLMDDVRGSTMRADDWLTLLDPRNASPSSARFHNKVVTARVIIITACIPPYEFFYYSKGVGQGTAQEEAIDQFLRRLMSIVEVYNYDDLLVKRALPSDRPRNYPVGIEHKYTGDKTIYTKSDYAIEPDDNLADCSREEVMDAFINEVLENNGFLDDTENEIIEAEVVPEGNEDN